MHDYPSLRLKDRTQARIGRIEKRPSRSFHGDVEDTGGRPSRSFDRSARRPDEEKQPRSFDEKPRSSFKQEEPRFFSSSKRPKDTDSYSDRPEPPERREPRTFKVRKHTSEDPTDVFQEAPTERQRSRPFDSPQLSEENDNHPVRVPYTTAASTFVYGYNAVLAALRARRRKLHALYIGPRSESREQDTQMLVSLARTADLKVTRNANTRLLDKMSDGRPHNGVVLEASKLPAPPLLALGEPSADSIPLTLAPQSAEDTAVNGNPLTLPTPSSPKQFPQRHPLILMLDGITDEGNLGSILRTAHFYSISAVAIATNTCAPLNSPIVAKASSGACEAIPVFGLPKPSNFVRDSKMKGWEVYAAVAPPRESVTRAWDPKTIEHLKLYTSTSSISQASPLTEKPVILMMGAEGEGLRKNLRRQATRFVTIERGLRAASGGEETQDVGVDSLNVGVATGVLVEAFMRKPVSAGPGAAAQEESEEQQKKEEESFGELGF